MADSIYKVDLIYENTWRIREDWAYCFLMVGKDRAMLMDTGRGLGDLKALVETLTDLPVILVNTHSDHDHAGGNGQFPVAYMHPAEYAQYHASPAGKGKAVEPLWEGDIIDLGGRTFEVLLIPGHTPGSIMLLERETGNLFTGDSVQQGTIYICGDGKDIHAYIAGIEKLETMKSRFKTLYPSHGAPELDTDIFRGLIDGAKNIVAGKVEGYTSPNHPVPGAMIYNIGVAEILY